MYTVCILADTKINTNHIPKSADRDDVVFTIKRAISLVSWYWVTIPRVHHWNGVKVRVRITIRGNSPDKLRHPRSDASTE